MTVHAQHTTCCKVRTSPFQSSRNVTLPEQIIREVWLGHSEVPHYFLLPAQRLLSVSRPTGVQPLTAQNCSFLNTKHTQPSPLQISAGSRSFTTVSSSLIDKGDVGMAEEHLQGIHQQFSSGNPCTGFSGIPPKISHTLVCFRAFLFP